MYMQLLSQVTPRGGRCTGDPQGIMSTTQCPGLNFKGEKEGMAGSWSKLVSTEISPRPTLIIWLSDVLLAAFENIVSETIQS